MFAVEVSDLVKSYGPFKAVKGISLAIAPGEIFGLLGPNGAGKSTTINMIAGVTRLGGGRIEVFGFDNQRDYRTTRRLVGVMHQEVVIDNFFTIDQTLKYGSWTTSGTAGARTWLTGARTSSCAL